MISSPTDISQNTLALFLLKTAKDQYVVKGAGSVDFQVGSIDDGAFIFQMPSVSEASDGLVLLQTLGGFKQVPADPSLGVVLQDSSATQAPFLKVPVGDGFALGTSDKEHWLSVSDDGKLVFSKLTSPGVSETFTAQSPQQPYGHNCCGHSFRPTPPKVMPSKVLWNAGGHKAIVEKAINCLREPLSPTSESYEFINRLDSVAHYSSELYGGLLEADESYELDEWPLYLSHFYDPDTETTWRKGNFPTALERGRDFFGASLRMLQYPSGNVSFAIGRRTYRPTPLTVNLVDADREDIVRTSFRMLGIALHYFTDISQPMHAANIPNTHDEWGTILDWRHSHFEAYGDLAVNGLLNNDAHPYPRLTFNELDVHNINGAAGLYKEMATQAKKAWVEHIKPIFDRKRFDEAWGKEALPGLKNSMYLAPRRVARLLAYWTYLDLKRLWDHANVGSSHVYAINNAGQVCMCSLDATATDEIRSVVMPGAPLAQEIGVGHDGSMWVISKEERAGGFTPYYLATGSHQWVRLQEPVAATKVGVAPDGTAYVLNASGQIWALGKPDADGKSQGRLLSNTLFARDIGVGGDGSVWVVSTHESQGNYVPYYLARGATDWMELTGSGAVKITGAPDGTARVITAAGEVWHMPKPGAPGDYRSTRLSELQGFFGKPYNIGVDRDGSLWVITSGGGDHGIHYLAKGAKQWSYFRYPGYNIPAKFAAI